ncbi:liver carboxylesterase 1 [Leptinotarsa decemlineata]|uniref:liver carboxylesterase 1 n=1 Tax=Leptinotarsa decemlineata TaxID=7539 RepID=UPI003D309279
MYAPPCIQPRPGTNLVVGSEDCLALNVFTPELPTGSEGLPVLVWIHGGGFRYGSASQYGVKHLVGKRLVVVTIQYRLGSLGFLSDGTKHLPGNVALWDMVLAVQWVRNYIGFFGGNPYRIVVMGHDTGASSALLLTLSNIAKGLTSGIIAMSGTAISRWAVDHTPHDTAQDIAKQNGCPTVNALTMVKCLQSLSPDSIVKGDSNIEFQRIQSKGFISGLSGDLGCAPVKEGFNDGRSLPGFVQDEPMNDMEKQRNPKVPLLTGIVKDETKKSIKGYLKTDILQKLNTIPDFVDKVLVEKLRQFVPLKVNMDIVKNVNDLGSSLTSLLPVSFKNYLKHNADNLLQTLDKISDVTNDALFNVPAFLTVDRWSKNGAQTFLYSFEHSGKLKKGNSFLLGSPLIGNSTNNAEESNDTVSHGDDLAYLFDAYDIEGNSLDTDNNISEDDKNVREFFTQMIADFARHGAPKVNNKIMSPFSSAKNNFLRIKAKPMLAEGFKFCEMALWCNIAERLKSTACAFWNGVNEFINKTSLNNLAPNKILEKVKPLDVLAMGSVKKPQVMDFVNGGQTNNVFPNLFGGSNENLLSPLNGESSSGKKNSWGLLDSQTTNNIPREQKGLAAGTDSQQMNKSRQNINGSPRNDFIDNKLDTNTSRNINYGQSFGNIEDSVNKVFGTNQKKYPDSQNIEKLVNNVFGSKGTNTDSDSNPGNMEESESKNVGSNGVRENQGINSNDISYKQKTSSPNLWGIFGNKNHENSRDSKPTLSLGGIIG